MSDTFLGQIEIFGFGFPPKTWAQCKGQLLPINQYQALFALLGTYYGGNGTTNFALPDLQGRVPVGFGTDQRGGQWVIGQKGGTEAIALTPNQIPAHTHLVMAAGATDVTNNKDAPNNTLGLGQSTGSDASGNTMVVNAFVAVASSTDYVTLRPTALSNGGSSTPHENRMPSIAMNVCISLAGVFPSRN
jgi:microcystin-dependent protein